MTHVSRHTSCYRDHCKGAVVAQATILDAHTRTDGTVREALRVPVCAKHALLQTNKGNVVTYEESTPNL